MIRHGPHREPGLAAPADIRLVRLDLDLATPLTDPLFDVLSGAERAAAERFRHHADRVRSAATRAVLRRLLGADLGAAPEGLTFALSDRGRPALAGTAALDFNVSHGGDHALIAWSRRRRVGVDVEPRRNDWDWRGLSAAVLGAEDARRLAEAAGDAIRGRLVLDAWVAKEALLKAEGSGITGGLAGFSVLPAAPGAPALSGAEAAGLAGFAAAWLRAIPGHAACLAWGRARLPS